MSQTAKQQREQRDRDLDIKPDFPVIKDQALRDECRFNLEKFCKQFQPHVYTLPFCESHKKALKALQQSVLKGGKFALALPRGFGKSSMAMSCVIWATSYGHSKYILLVCANASRGKQLIENIQREMVTNTKYLECFPEVVWPFHKLSGIWIRAKTQRYDGHITQLQFGQRIVTSDLHGYTYQDDNRSIIIEATSLGGNIRGRQTMTRQGLRRPQTLVIDDPCDRSDAESITATDKLRKIIQADVIGTAGHETPLSACCLCTVIKEGDLASSMLSDAVWRGQRESIIKKYPDEWDGMWRNYFTLRRQGLSEGDNGKEATAYYKANREKLDAGAVCTWEKLKSKGEVSALQHVANLYVDSGEEAFASEYCNEPLQNQRKVFSLDEKTVLARINRHPRYDVIESINYVFACIDVNLYGLTYVVTGFSRQHAYVIDYGMISDDGKQRQELTDGQYVQTLLLELIKHIESLPYAPRLTGMLIDTRYQGEAIRNLIKSLPAKKYSVASSIGFATTNYLPSRDARWNGNGCYEKMHLGVMTLMYNADVHKLRALKAFTLEVGVDGGLTLFNGVQGDHTAFARQICGEYLSSIDEKGKHIWVSRVSYRHDALDCLQLCYVCAERCQVFQTNDMRKEAVAGRVEKKKKMKRKAKHTVL